MYSCTGYFNNRHYHFGCAIAMNIVTKSHYVTHRRWMQFLAHLRRIFPIAKRLTASQTTKITNCYTRILNSRHHHQKVSMQRNMRDRNDVPSDRCKIPLKHFALSSVWCCMCIFFSVGLCGHRSDKCKTASSLPTNKDKNEIVKFIDHLNINNYNYCHS